MLHLRTFFGGTKTSEKRKLMFPLIISRGEGNLEEDLTSFVINVNTRNHSLYGHQPRAQVLHSVLDNRHKINTVQRKVKILVNLLCFPSLHLSHSSNLEFKTPHATENKPYFRAANAPFLFAINLPFCVPRICLGLRSTPCILCFEACLLSILSSHKEINYCPFDENVFHCCGIVQKNKRAARKELDEKVKTKTYMSMRVRKSCSLIKRST